MNVSNIMKKIIAIAGALLMALAAVCPAFAEEGGAVITWDEIGSIIEERNPTYLTYFESANDTLNELSQGASDDILSLRDALEEADDAVAEVRSAEKNLLAQGGTKDSAQYMALEASIAAAQAMRSEIKSSLASMGSTLRSVGYTKRDMSKTMSLVKYQLEDAVKSLIISYKSLEVSERMLEAQASLYESLLGSALDMEAQGLMAPGASDTYRDSFEQAEASLSSLRTAKEQIRGYILVQCGYDRDALVTIGDLPEPDVSYYSSRDRDADRDAAVNNNAAVIDAGKVSAYTGDLLKHREDYLNQARAAAVNSFEKISAALEEQTILAGSSDVSSKKAELLERSAETKYSLGLLSMSEYEAAKLEYIVARATISMNQLGLHQAIQDYGYALMGIMDVDTQ